jgi:predicted transcriptional regulator
MAASPIAAVLLEARRQAGLTQRDLARRAGTAQSVVARIEAGTTSPTWDTLARLVRAAGFDPRVGLDLRPTRTSHMLEDVPRILLLTPEERLRELGNVARFISSARRRG